MNWQAGRGPMVGKWHAARSFLNGTKTAHRGGAPSHEEAGVHTIAATAASEALLFRYRRKHAHHSDTKKPQPCNLLKELDPRLSFAPAIHGLVLLLHARLAGGVHVLRPTGIDKLLNFWKHVDDFKVPGLIRPITWASRPF
jgi:hypothetical protein